MLGNQISLHLPLAMKEEILPSATDYDPKFTLTMRQETQPRPMHRTAPRKSPFDVEEGGSQGQAEAMLKRAMAGGEGAVKKEKEEPKFHTSTPSWSMCPKRPVKVRDDWGATLYGPTSSMG